MKKVYIQLFCVFLTGLFLMTHAMAQGPVTTPDEPILQSVSIDPISGDVTITWSMPDPPVSSVPYDGFIIFWLNYQTSDNYVIETIHDATARSYTFHPDSKILTPPMPDPRMTTVPFTIASFQNNPWTTSLRSDEDYAMQLSNKYDSCRAEIRLSWHPYKGWYSSRPPYKPLINYKVMQIPEGGGTPELVKTVSDQDTSYVVLRAEENKQYSYYVEAERSDGVKTTSYRTEVFTKMPAPPTYIIAEGTEYNDQGIAEITFQLDPASETHVYEFLGSSKSDYSYVSLGTLENITGDKLVLPDIQTREKTYYYKLAAWHLCKNKYTLESNIATALWIYLLQEDQVNALQWDKYTEWGVPAKYNVYRKIGSNSERIIATLNDGTDKLSYRDDVSGIPIDGDICYWIEAEPENPSSSAQKAISNRKCIQPESDIFVPEAFTPNGDGRNDEYRPYFSYDPQEYLFIAYDRNGAKVFETKNLTEAWDGRLKNGKPANEGIYAYYIKFRTAMGRLVEKRGTFALVLPK
ncbi:MAG: gliding motility-associated C-terminal domain-containing protein [Bacteroidales bacterium]|jgi:gliding motility-associated-like protein|nr:gliding motility-associated C-terminal domain-containing protein [Bacteroidales bacterium]